MLKKTLYKHTREFLERNLPENFFLFKKSNKKRIKYFSYKCALIKLNLSKLKLNKNKLIHIERKPFSLYEGQDTKADFPTKYKYTSKAELDRKFLFNLYTIKSIFEKRQTRNSYFKNKLKEKKKLAILYGNLSNKHIKHALFTAIKQTGNISINLLHILEKRLDIILYRALFFPTINSAKQWLSHNKVTVNSVYTNVPSYMVRPGDIIGVSKGLQKDVCNNMIKHFIHYKLIENTNSNLSNDGINTNTFALLGNTCTSSKESLYAFSASSCAFSASSASLEKPYTEHSEKIGCVHSSFLENISDKYKLNLYKAFLNIKRSDLNHKLRNYCLIFYSKGCAENLKYVYKYIYSYNFIAKKFLSFKHNFRLKPRTIINRFYFKVLYDITNFNNVFLYVKMYNLLKNRFLINDISKCTQLKKTHKKNMFNTYVYTTSTNIFNCKCKILMSKINHKIKSVVYNIVNGLHGEKKNLNNSVLLFNEYINTKPDKNSIIKRLGIIISDMSKTQYYDFLFFLKIKKIFTEHTVHSTQYDKKLMLKQNFSSEHLKLSRNKIHSKNLPNYYNLDNSSQGFSAFAFEKKKGKINIKPLNLEISYLTLTIIYLFPPQKLIFPCALDMELLMKYDI